MSLATPSKIRELQIKLYRKAKNEPGYRFYMLYDKVYREDILAHAYALAKSNGGAPGVDAFAHVPCAGSSQARWEVAVQQPAAPCDGRSSVAGVSLAVAW